MHTPEAVVKSLADKDLLALAREGNMMAAALLIHRMGIPSPNVRGIIAAWMEAGSIPVHAARKLAFRVSEEGVSAS